MEVKMPWQVFNADHEIPGRILIDLANAVGADEILPYFQKHGLTNIDPDAWYPEQKLLDVYNDMSDTKDGTMFDFISIGIKEAQQARVPEAFTKMPLLEILQGIAQVFKLNNRGTDYGEVWCETLDDHHVKIHMRTPQPDDLWYGAYYGFVRRFLPPGTHFTVAYDDSVKRRDLGGEVTILRISWE
jgi:hypothetical protein